MKTDDGFRIQKENPRKKLEELIAPTNRALITDVVNKGYMLASKASKDFPFISGQEGTTDFLSRMKSLAIKFYMKQYCDKGILPFKYKVKPNETKNHDYLLIYNDEGSFHLTINQCKNMNKPAVPAGYRIQENKNFQSYFDFDFNEYKTSDFNDDNLYLELDHGYQSEQPMFIGLGIPKNDKSWYSVIDLAKETPVLRRNFITKPADIKKIDVDTFKEFIRNKG